MADEKVEVVRWYTLARKFPRLVGKAPDGTVLWGGPYTLVQLFGSVGAGVAGFWITGFLGLNIIPRVLVLTGILIVAVLALGRIPVGGRNPVLILLSTLRLLCGPSGGRLRGRAQRRFNAPRPHRVNHQVLIAFPPSAAVVGGASDQGETAADETPPKSALLDRFAGLTAHNTDETPNQPAMPLTGVQRILAGLDNNRRSEN